MFAFNRKAYVAQTNGEAGANKVIRNTFTPPNFVQIDGKQFGDAVEKDLEAYGDEWKGVSVADGKDTLYNPNKAKEEFAKAKGRLAVSRSWIPNSFGPSNFFYLYGRN